MFNSTDGTNGKKGEDASPCKSTALKVKASTDFNLMNQLPAYELNCSYSVENRVKDDSCPDTFTKTNERAAKPNPGKPLKVVPSVIEYKTFLRENMANPPLMQTARKVYAAIDSNANISGAYVVTDFAREINTLQRQYDDLREHVDFLPFYDNLLRGIKSYAIANLEAAQNWEADRERQQLTQMCASIWGSKMGMRNGRKSDLIIAIERYFGFFLY